MHRRSGWVVALLVVGCVTPKVQAPPELPLKKVAIYRNGVGYFERSGKVNEERLQFRIKPEHVGDFLATLAVMEKGGSSLRSASFPLHLMDPPPPPVPVEGAPPGTSPLRPDGMERVVLELDGKEHQLAVGYVTEQPVWKPSYRLVLGKEGQPTLQAWGIVQNLSGEDWKDVMLSLVAGAPIAFSSTLQVPVTPPRPVVSDQGEVISAVPRSQSTYAPVPPPPPPQAAPEMGRAPSAAPAPPRSGARPRSKKAPMDRSESAPSMEAPAAGAPEAEYGMEDASPRNLSLLAAQTVEGGATRYDLPHPVTIPNDSATLVLLMAQPVKGEAVFMFAPEGGVPDSFRHPFRVARFTNTTRGLLERGPIAVYEASSFLGQGVMESLSAGGEATVPFALERGIAVEVETRTATEDARISQIEHGRLQLERDQVIRTRYRLRNGGQDEVKVVLRHPRSPESRLHQPPPGTEDLPAQNLALVPAKVGPYGKGEVQVDERRGYPMGADWFSPEADQAVRAYLADPRADRKVVAVLTQGWVLRDALVKATQERQKLQSEQGILQSAAEQAREGLRSIARHKSGVDDLRRQLTTRLAELDEKLAHTQRRLVELELQINEQQVRFTELLRDLRVSQSLPPA